MDVGFCIDVTVFVKLLLVSLGANQTVFLPIAEFLDCPNFGAVVSLVTIGSGVEFYFGSVS